MFASNRKLLGTVLLLMSGTAVAANGRVIFDNPDYAVTVPGDNKYCEQPITATLETGDPNLLESDSGLQRIVDATQAVLGYECPELHTVKVHGRLNGLPDPVFRGVAYRDSGWQLETRQSFESRNTGADWGSEPTEPLPESAFNVANLEAGMSVDEAVSTVEETFGVEAEYEPQDGMLSMHTGGCPAGYDWAALSPIPQPGWKCLTAWFTDQRMERLYLVELIQVVEGERVQSIDDFLTDQFGEPVHRHSRNGEQGWRQEKPPRYTLAWGENVGPRLASNSGEQPEQYSLQARIVPVEGVTILAVTLYEPALQPDRSARSERPDLDLDL